MPTLRTVPPWLQDAIATAEAEGRIVRDSVTAKPEEFPEPIAPRDEDDFQAMVVEFAKSREWLCYHTRNSRRSEPGWPDLAMVRSQVLVIAELKFGNNTATPEQRKWLKALSAIPGVQTFVWYPQDWPEVLKVLR